MSNLIKAEFYKSRFAKSVYFSQAFSILLTAIKIIATLIAHNEEYAPGISTGKGLILGTVSFNYIALFLAILISTMISNAYKNGDIENALTGNATRTQLYLVYFLEFAFIAFIFVVVNYLASGFMSIFIGYGSKLTLTEFGILVERMFLQYLCMLGYVSLYLMIAMLATTIGKSIGGTFGFFVIESAIFVIYNILLGRPTGVFLDLFDFQKYISGITNAITIKDTNIIDNSLKCLLDSHLHATSLVDSMELKDLLLAIFVPLIYVILFLVIGILAFKKKDIEGHTKFNP